MGVALHADDAQASLVAGPGARVLGRDVTALSDV
jgi:hypothetical protein